MSSEWIVQPGECLSVIAEESGLFWETIWNHARNKQLRIGGRSPTVLKPGDVVFVPDKRRGEESCETGRRHIFRIKGIPAFFRVRILDSEDKPRTGLPYTLDIDGSVTNGTIPENGVVSKEIPPKAIKATLKVRDPLEGEEVYEFHLGHLHPIGEMKGVQSRLKNLGYLEPDANGAMDDATESAIAKFQAKNGLPATGEPDGPTRGALLAAHGC